MSVSGTHLEPLHWFCRVFTVWPFDGNISIKSLDMYYRCVVCVVTMYASYFYYIIITESTLTTNLIVLDTYFIDVGFRLLHHLSMLVMGFSSNHTMKNILRNISSVNEKLKETGIIVDGNRFYFVQFGVIIGYLLINLPQFYFIILREYPTKLSIYPSMFTIYVEGSMPLMITGLAHLLETQAKLINTQLGLLFEDLRISSSHEVLTRLKKLINIHNNIRGIIQDINFAFHIPLLFYMAFILTESCANLISVLMTTYNLPQHANAWFLYFFTRDFVMLLLLSECCHSAALEVNKTVLLAHGLHQRHSHHSILNEMTVTVTTYLVICLQIKDVHSPDVTTELNSIGVENITLSLS